MKKIFYKIPWGKARKELQNPAGGKPQEGN
jgi:hypothetical protein